MRNKNNKFRRVPEDFPIDQLKPLNITCGSTKCEAKLHCFSLKKTSIKNYGKVGVCRDCGSDLIDWARIHLKDLKDIEFTFSAMKTELIRHVFWHTEIDELALDRAIKEGKLQIQIRSLKVLKNRVGKLNSYWDGRQTPMGSGDIINYAQHATATCCRKCIEIWHNIPLEKELTDEQLSFFSELIMLYTLERIPEIAKDE